MNGVQFTSQKNYLKNKQADTFTGTISKPATYDANANVYYSELSIDHGLLERPIVRFWYDPNNSGQRVPAFGRWDYSSAISDYCDEGDVPFDLMVYNITASSVTIRTAARSSISGSCNIYYKIYLDPTQ